MPVSGSSTERVDGVVRTFLPLLHSIRTPTLTSLSIYLPLAFQSRYEPARSVQITRSRQASEERIKCNIPTTRAHPSSPKTSAPLASAAAAISLSTTSVRSKEWVSSYTARAWSTLRMDFPFRQSFESRLSTAALAAAGAAAGVETGEGVAGVAVGVEIGSGCGSYWLERQNWDWDSNVRRTHLVGTLSYAGVGVTFRGKLERQVNELI